MVEAQVTSHIVEPLTEGDFANAVFRLGTMHTRHPLLKEAEQRARVELAAAIIAYDEAPDFALAHRAGYIDLAVQKYAQALAAMLRGEYEEET